MGLLPFAFVPMYIGIRGLVDFLNSPTASLIFLFILRRSGARVLLLVAVAFFDLLRRTVLGFTLQLFRLFATVIFGAHVFLLFRPHCGNRRICPGGLVSRKRPITSLNFATVWRFNR